MQLLLLLIISVFASNEKEASENSEPNIFDNSILVKIEEDEYNKTKKSNYTGLTYKEKSESWRAYRYSKNEKKTFYNGYYKDEKTAARASDFLARKFIANGEKNHRLNFPDDDFDVHPPEKTSKYIGVCYFKSKWGTWRWSKNEKKVMHNGTSYKDEETAARASDTLARKLIANGEKVHKLNFPDDNTEVYLPKKSSDFIGVYYHERRKAWSVQRWSKEKCKTVHNGYYQIENTAAHASDTLARELIANGENGHKFNFPDDHTEVHPKKSSNYIGVSYNEQRATWTTQRWSKKESKMVRNGHYKSKETAAIASDTLAKKLLANGEKGHRLNFPDDDTEVYPEEVGRTNFIGVSYNERTKICRAKRWSKDAKKEIYIGIYKDEKTAAHASDNLARKLIANGEKGHKLNFPDNKTEVYPNESLQNKRKRSAEFDNSQKCGNSLEKFD